MTITDILDAARQSPEAVTALCAGLTDDALRAEIERWNRAASDSRSLGMLKDARSCEHARAALETERDRRTKAAMIATLPEQRR